MTFEEFVASKIRVADVSPLWGGEVDAQLPGVVYCPSFDKLGVIEGGFVILDEADEGHTLIIANGEWHSKDLAILERTLWDEFAKDEVEMMEAQSVT